MRVLLKLFPKIAAAKASGAVRIKTDVSTTLSIKHYLWKHDGQVSCALLLILRCQPPSSRHRRRAAASSRAAVKSRCRTRSEGSSREAGRARESRCEAATASPLANSADPALSASTAAAAAAWGPTGHRDRQHAGALHGRRHHG